MEIIQFQDLFKPFRGANTKNMPELTEKVIYSLMNYKNEKKLIPVLSGSEANEGIIGFVPNFLEKLPEENSVIEKNKIRYFVNNQGCITMIRCGNAGRLFFRSKEKYPLFSLTTSIFNFFKRDDSKIKEKYSNYDGLNLEWFSMKFDFLFSNLIIQEGLSTISLTIINPIKLEIPSLSIQNEEMKTFRIVKNFMNDLKIKLSKLENMREKYLELKENGEDEIPLNYFLKHKSRNDCLSHQGIYKRSENLKFSLDKLNVLSGSFDEIYGIVPLDKKLHHIKNKFALQVITRGKAGRIKFLEKGNYATNTNSMLLVIKNEIKKEFNIFSEEDEEIFLKFLEFYLEPIFLKFISSADLGVLPLTEILKEVKVSKIILNQEIKSLVGDYEKLKKYTQELYKKEEGIKKLLKKQIIFN